MLLAGCVSESTLRGYVPQIVTPYRIDIQQGNFITPDMVQIWNKIMQEQDMLKKPVEPSKLIYK